MNCISQVAGSDQSSGNHLILLQDPKKITTFAKTTTGRHGMKKSDAAETMMLNHLKPGLSKAGAFKKNTQLTKKYQAASCSHCAASADFLLTGKPMASANSEARIHLPCLGDHKMFPAWRRLGFACSPRSTSCEKLGFEIDQRGILRHEMARCQSLSSTSTCMLPGIHAALA